MEVQTGVFQSLILLQVYYVILNKLSPSERHSQQSLALVQSFLVFYDLDTFEKYMLITL